MALVGVILVIVVSRNAFSREIKNNLKPSKAEPENSCRAARVAPCAPLDRFLLSFFPVRPFQRSFPYKIYTSNRARQTPVPGDISPFPCSCSKQKRTRDLIERNGYRGGARRDSIGGIVNAYTGGLALSEQETSQVTDRQVKRDSLTYSVRWSALNPGVCSYRFEKLR